MATDWTRSIQQPASRSCCAGFSELKDDGIDRVRVLDLQRRVPEPAATAPASASVTRQSAAAGLGLRLAAQPPHHVQPRVGRSRGQAVVGAEEAHLVGRRSRSGGSAPTSPTSSPTSRRTIGRRRGHTGMDAIAGDAAVHHEAGRRRLAVRAGGERTARCPTHYEPVESPVRQPALSASSRTTRRCASSRARSIRLAHTPTAEYPVVATTFRLTEHYLSGPMSRFNSWLNELQPEMFVELSPELAAERGIEHGGWLTVRSARGAIEAARMVTRRLQPLTSRGGSSTRSAFRFTGALPARRRRQRQRSDVAGGRSERQHARGQGVRV